MPALVLSPPSPRGTLVVIDEGALPGIVGSAVSRQVSLGFGGEKTIEVILQPGEWLGNSDYQWIGKVKGDDYSTVILTRSGEAFYGLVSTQGDSYGIRPAGPSGLAIAGQEIAMPDLKVCGDPPQAPNTSQQLSPQVPPVAGAILDGTVNVGFIYTAALKEQVGGSLSGARALGHACLSYANLALLANRQSFRFRLVDAKEVAYVETGGDLNTDLYNLTDVAPNGTPDTIHPQLAPAIQSLRDGGADLIVLLVHKPQGATNLGLGFVYGADPRFGHSAVNAFVMDTPRVVAHEIGHNRGCRHDALQVGNGWTFTPYSRGYISPLNRGDIMSYAFATGALEIP